MVAGKQMGEFVKRHRTLSAPGDTVALMQPTDTQGKRPAFTTERQFAVTGHMAMPVLDAIANDLKRRFNIDLVAAPTRPRSMPAARPTWAASSARPVATSRRSAPTRWTA